MPKKTRLPFEQGQSNTGNATTESLEGQSTTLSDTPESVQKQQLHSVSEILKIHVQPGIEEVRGNPELNPIYSYKSDFWVQAADVKGKPPPAPGKDDKPAIHKKPSKPPKQDFTNWHPTEAVSFPVEQNDLIWFKRVLRKGLYTSCIVHLVIFILTFSFTVWSWTDAAEFKKLSYGVFTLLILMMFVYISYTTLVYLGAKKVDLIYLIGAEMLIKVKFVIELAVTISGLTYVSFRSIVYARRVRYNRPYEWYEEYYMLDTFLIIYFLCLLVYCIFGQFRESVLLNNYITVLTSDKLKKHLVARALFFTCNSKKIALVVAPKKQSPA